MQGRRLAVLMWKHGTVRMRRYIHTPIEIVSPIIFMILLFCFKNNLKAVRPTALSAEHYEIRNTDVLRFTDLSTPKRILYTPDSKLTNDLMDAVGEQLGLKRIEKLPDRHWRGYYGFTNYTEITSYISDLYSDEAIIIFDDMKDRETWPEHPRLSYTIRLKDLFYTNTYASMDGVMNPHRQFGSIYKQFMKLQWAIDTSFIKVLTGNNVTQQLRLQEFPSIGRSENNVITLICTILQILCMLSLLLVFVFLMARLLEERSTGIQELLKMVGVSTNLYGISHFLNTVPAGLVYCIGTIILLKVTSNPLIDYSSALVIFVVLLLHYVSIIAMGFACSYITKSTQYAVSLSVFAYITLWIPARLVTRYPAKGIVLLSGLLPHVPMQWLWEEIGQRELYGEGLLMSDIATSHSTQSGSVLLGIVCMLLQIALFFVLAWYLSLVRPGNYGQALPWNFLFQTQYWTKNEVIPQSEFEEEIPIVREAKYFEEPPKNLEPGIRIENVSKVFPKNMALNHVSLDVYKGEITVLLGHNGAGKTVLMSIITGMISATEGRVLINGMDINKKGDAVRMQLGLCPQHNLFFPDLTVLEHTMLFAMLKGSSYKDAKEKCLHLLDKLGMKDKANTASATLSGGMKRRLQLACALAGDANVLVLDEPTSGLDVETRRELWDLLLSLRGDRTVLLTTHFMEEADALGDRVAALHLGQLRCHATTMHLKKAIGTGYRLTFTTLGHPRDAAITDAVTSHVPDATLKEKTINSLSYNLPATASKHFPALFTALEERRSELAIETIGVGVSTLEEVFLKLCSDTDNAFNEDEVDTTRAEPTYNKVTGPVLYGRQFLVLLKRQFKYVMYKKSSFFILQVLAPIVVIFLITATCNNEKQTSDRNGKMSLDLDVYASMPHRKVLVDVQAADVSIRPLNDRYPKVDFVKTTNISEAVLRSAEKDASEYNKYLAGFEISDTDVKVQFTTIVRHAAPVAMNLLTNALATRYIPSADGSTITTYIHPVKPEGGTTFDDKLNAPKTMDMALTWCIVIVFIILATNTNCVSLPCKERDTSSRHIHVMSGCPALVHWAATCLFHIAVCFVFLITTTAVAAATLDTDNTINKPDVIMSLVLILTLAALSFFAFMYLVSFSFSETTTSIVLIAVLIIFGLITTSIKTASDLLKESDSMSFGDSLLWIASVVMPPHAATVAVGKCLNIARLNAYCELNKDRCPALFVAESGFDTEKCCAGENPRCYMCIDSYAPGKEMIILACQFVVYMTLVIITQRGIFNCFKDCFQNGGYRRSTRSQNVEGDEVVRAEAVYVSKQIALPREKIAESNQALLASDLHKNFVNIIGKSFTAVRGVSFSVKKGECFGLLGVNGAGKSTTFKMLTGEECPTKGTIYANGYFNKERQPYLRSLGYCPQFFGLDEFQTGRENLTLLLTLRGLDAADVSQEVNSWINVVGLSKYSDRLVVGYSGGCARRLAAAAALSSGAPVTLLDEPTSGVDVSARRRVWSALKRGLRQGRSVIITSHSMDEMEALCSRIAIMAAGVVRAVGTPSELRAHHAAGHAVIIKVNQRSASRDVVDSAKSDIERLKSSLEHKFNCTLKDQHKTMLHYHINETMRYSNLFSALEELKASYPGLVEDYSVTETTLEEVFLALAREQRETPPSTPPRNHIV